LIDIEPRGKARYDGSNLATGASGMVDGFTILILLTLVMSAVLLERRAGSER
jgi:hypothetical protein